MEEVHALLAYESYATIHINERTLQIYHYVRFTDFPATSRTSSNVIGQSPRTHMLVVILVGIRWVMHANDAIKMDDMSLLSLDLPDALRT